MSRTTAFEVGVGVALGVVLGVVLGVTEADSLGVGLPLGALTMATTRLATVMTRATIVAIQGQVIAGFLTSSVEVWITVVRT